MGKQRRHGDYSRSPNLYLVHLFKLWGMSAKRHEDENGTDQLSLWVYGRLARDLAVVYICTPSHGSHRLMRLV